MKKLFPILIIFCAIILFFPFNTWGQLDIDIQDIQLDIPIGNLGDTLGNTEPEINLKTLELYWSADTYVPFGYEGRTLPTQGSFVTINAYLDVSGGSPQSLKYSWFLDGNFQEAKSGYGQSRFKFGIRRTAGASHTVLVKIFNESNSFYVEKSITIPITHPELVVYNKNNSRANLPYIASAKNFKITSDKESSFLALPYFFNIKSIKDLEFEWTLGEKSAKQSSFTANVFGLKIINKGAGTSLEENLKVVVTNKLQSNQIIQKIIKLNIE